MHAPFTAELSVERYLRGLRIDTFLARHFRNYSSFRIQRMIRAGQVRVNGVTVELEHRVQPRQRVAIRLIEPPDKLLHPEPGRLDVIFEDPWLVVINKPPGQIVHPVGDFAEAGSLSNLLQHHLDRQTPLRGLLRPGIVHRLDRETSGVMAVAKEHLSHRTLSIQFQRQQVAKAYLALVEGLIARDSGTIDLPLGTAPGGKSILASAKADARDRRPARTTFQVLSRFAKQSLVRARPLTGRLHQIRVHLAEIGHPVLGDEFYGPHGVIKTTPQTITRRRRALSNGQGGDSSGADPGAVAAPDGVARGEALMTRHALHAERLEFAHPITGDWLTFEATLPEDMRDALGRLGGQG